MQCLCISFVFVFHWFCVVHLEYISVLLPKLVFYVSLDLECSSLNLNLCCVAYQYYYMFV